jgi:hypothetical protein
MQSADRCDVCIRRNYRDQSLTSKIFDKSVKSSMRRSGQARLHEVLADHECGDDDATAARKWGRCGLAGPRVLAGGSPAWVIVSREPSIEPCGVDGNGHVDA